MTMSVEDSPEFQKALKDACDKQWGNWLYGGGFKKSSRRNVEKDLARIQEIKDSAEAKAEAAKMKAEQLRREAEELRRKNNPMLRRITATLSEKSVLKVGLICPLCGEPDKGNKINKTPSCLKCNVALVTPKQVKDWVHIKQGNMDSVKRGLRGLP